MNHDTRLKRLRFRAWHRGTREADLLIGGFFDARAAGWNEGELDWFETLLEEQDVDIIMWAMGSAPPPTAFAGGLMPEMQRIDYLTPPAQPA
ncbi:FAD assembly factor SdhE [Sphingomonas antarctica]|uniref:FAD assembly factor SdhE n=1 Tax=Sphingomonas antarctica TaxID=2040274 RepID=UPI0039ECE84B